MDENENNDKWKEGGGEDKKTHTKEEEQEKEDDVEEEKKRFAQKIPLKTTDKKLIAFLRLYGKYEEGSHSTWLKIDLWIVPAVGQASIAGAPEVFVKRGSTISLLCTVSTNQRTGAVTWYQGPSLIDFDAPRGGIALETERTDAGTTSKLLVTRAEMADSGNYTCLPAHARPASVYVHVLNGEHPAAMQHGEHASASSKLVAWSITLLSAIGAITDLL
ncbi:uncharacterized protein LOC111054794 [Nilaparvata lugens]|uniref:uncharacterized protein LOC111054794 n=1 Tax=Nilaparvata lugens TaxID=108931 RepID=UPI00193DCB1F|nr:uncharacterized protein LOC111054794 [Nilaparvata lugens]